MKAIQITIDEHLLQQVDKVASEVGATRSAFVRDALQSAIKRFEIQKLESQHAAGYARYPVQPGEFDIWEAEQDWGDE